MVQRLSDWHNDTAVIRNACERTGMGVIGMHPRQPRFVELNSKISDDVTSRIDLAALHDRYVR